MKFKHIRIFEIKTDVLLTQELPARLTQYGYNELVRGQGFIYAPGTLPICLVSHVDVVHFRDVPFVLYDRKKRVLWSPDGLGADDRAGICAIIELLNRGWRPHVIFLDGEEKGLTGAKEAAKAVPPPDIKFMIEFDRKGVKDAVYYDLDNKKFENYIERFGFKTATGSCSDISALAPAWKVAAVNLSIGYFDPHTKQEHLFLDIWENTVNKTENILTNLPGKVFHYYEKPKPTYFRGKYDYATGNWENYSYCGYYYKDGVYYSNPQTGTTKGGATQNNTTVVPAKNPIITVKNSPSTTVGSLNPIDQAIIAKKMAEADKEETKAKETQEPLITKEDIEQIISELSTDKEKAPDPNNQKLMDTILELEMTLGKGAEQNKPDKKVDNSELADEGFLNFGRTIDVLSEEVDDETGEYEIVGVISAQELALEFGGSVHGWRKWLKRRMAQIEEISEDNINFAINKLIQEDTNWIMENVLQYDFGEEAYEESEEGVIVYKK